MKNYGVTNIILGWTAFLIAFVVYLLTLEPTAGFWDCGEFIATSYKLEVGHPPGAPFFMILGRFFTLFAGSDTSKVALSMNVLSALMSALTILFLFWTITQFVKRIVASREGITRIAGITIFGSALVGSMTYTFSDSFWFSAVEAEVYSTSSLFTALVFWAMLRWEEVAEEPGANRWIILIAYLMGLSIGVHLLNLLTIPALVFIFYFRKYTISVKGVLISGLLSATILGCLMYILIPGLTWFAGKFELLFVNGLGLPFNSGLLIYLVLIFGGLIFGMYYTLKRRLVLGNTLILGLFVIVLGYSSYGVILIRSSADTPLDEGNPDTVFSLLSYLNRDQYGDCPLLYGAYFNHLPVNYDGGNVTYYKGEKDYYSVPTSGDYVFEDGAEGFFPRMWSVKPEHASEYIYWASLEEAKLYAVKRDPEGNPIQEATGKYSFDRNQAIGRPSFAENLRFFFRYQIGHMYLRYFMWNFSGRQNDIQGNGELTKGNWITGFNLLDNARLGPSNLQPDYLKQNKGNNKYYMLPLVLGLIGAFFHYRKRRQDFWIISLLFFFTGLAILVYLNQHPLQPRERDYAYVGSFYAFAIWIGIGMAGLIRWLAAKRNPLVVSLFVIVVLVLVPLNMALENWDDHDRSNRYTAPAFARNFLNSCLPGAVLFTAADNDTFPLWYMQEVEGVRTDVRVANLSYLTADWYIRQMKTSYYDSEALPISMEQEHYNNGGRDRVYLVESAGVLLKEKYSSNKSKYEKQLLDIYFDFMSVVEGSMMQKNHPKDFGVLKSLEESMDPLQLFGYLSALTSEDISDQLQLDKNILNILKSRMGILIKSIDADYAPLKKSLEFLFSDETVFAQNQYYLPSRKFTIPIDTSQLADWVIPDTFYGEIAQDVKLSLSERVIHKNLLTIIDLLGTNNWDRPIYYASSVPSKYYLNLENYFIREGFAYRVSPVLSMDNTTIGQLNTDDMFMKLMEEFDWGGLSTPGIYLDENNLRMLTHYRLAFALLAGELAKDKEFVKARSVLDRCMENLPKDTVPLSTGINQIIQGYFAAGDRDTALNLTEEYEEKLISELSYYTNLSDKKRFRSIRSAPDMLSALREVNSLRIICANHGQDNIAGRLESSLDKYGQVFERYFL